MNKLLFSIFLFCIVAASLISCNNDDEALLPNVEASEMQFIKLDDTTGKAFLCRDDQDGGRLRFFSVEDVKAVFRVSYPKRLGEIY